MTDRETTIELGSWIRERRVARSLSQRGLADQAGVSRSYLCDIERGRGGNPSLDTLDKLAAALGASREEILTASGVIDEPQRRNGDAERRLLGLFRGLSDDGQKEVERFIRFLRSEEILWNQLKLFDVETDAPIRHSATESPLFDEAAQGVE